MKDEYLMFSASILYFICYVPELYATYKNKNANVYNMPEKFLVTIGSVLALTYAVRTNSIPLMTNYAPILTLDVITLSARLYYASQNGYSPQPVADTDTKTSNENLDL